MAQILVRLHFHHIRKPWITINLSVTALATPLAPTETPIVLRLYAGKDMNMNSLRFCKANFQSMFIPTHFDLPKTIKGPACIKSARTGRKPRVIACAGGEEKSEKRSFLSLEEAGLVEVSSLSSHERFLCRLTISSLNLLRVIAEEEGCAIEELNAGRVCDWFLKDKLKREQNLESAVLQWDDDPQFEF